MSLPIKLISTDFDGTIFAEFEHTPIPEKLQELIGDLQSRGAKWVINTGRDMSSLMEALGRSKISIEPDYLVLVERETLVRHARENRTPYEVAAVLTGGDRVGHFEHRPLVLPVPHDSSAVR